MKLKELYSRGIKQIKRKNEIKKLQKEIEKQRELLSESFLVVGEKIESLEEDNQDPYIEDQTRSMNNVLSMIKNLEKENLDFSKNIETKKREYDKRINQYPELISDLNESTIKPTKRLVENREKLEVLKIELKKTRDLIKNKEEIFSDNEKIMSQQNEEHLLNEEKNMNLKEEQARLQKELLEITQKFEILTEESNEIKDRIGTIENEISTTMRQVTTYKKEVSYLKKEKIREIKLMNKLVKNNETSILMRKEELKHIFRSIGSLAYEKRLFPEILEPEYIKIDEINKFLKQISENKYLNSVESEKEENNILLKFYSVIILIIISIIFIIWLLAQLGGSSIKEENPKKSFIENLNNINRTNIDTKNKNNIDRGMNNLNEDNENINHDLEKRDGEL